MGGNRLRLCPRCAWCGDDHPSKKHPSRGAPGDSIRNRQLWPLTSSRLREAIGVGYPLGGAAGNCASHFSNKKLLGHTHRESAPARPHADIESDISHMTFSPRPARAIPSDDRYSSTSDYADKPIRSPRIFLSPYKRPLSTTRFPVAKNCRGITPQVQRIKNNLLNKA